MDKSLEKILATFKKVKEEIAGRMKSDGSDLSGTLTTAARDAIQEKLSLKDHQLRSSQYNQGDLSNYLFPNLLKRFGGTGYMIIEFRPTGNYDEVIGLQLFANGYNNQLWSLKFSGLVQNRYTRTQFPQVIVEGNAPFFIGDNLEAKIHYNTTNNKNYLVLGNTATDWSGLLDIVGGLLSANVNDNVKYSVSISTSLPTGVNSSTDLNPYRFKVGKEFRYELTGYATYKIGDLQDYTSSEYRSKNLLLRVTNSDDYNHTGEVTVYYDSNTRIFSAKRVEPINRLANCQVEFYVYANSDSTHSLYVKLLNTARYPVLEILTAPNGTRTPYQVQKVGDSNFVPPGTFVDSTVGMEYEYLDTQSLKLIENSVQATKDKWRKDIGAVKTSTNSSGNSGLDNYIVASSSFKRYATIQALPQEYYQGAMWEFIQADKIGLPSGNGVYCGLHTFRQYADGSASSGGGVHQLAFSDVGNLYYRYGYVGINTWANWKRIANDGDLANYLTRNMSNLSSDLTTAEQTTIQTKLGITSGGGLTEITHYPSNVITQFTITKLQLSQIGNQFQFIIFGNLNVSSAPLDGWNKICDFPKDTTPLNSEPYDFSFGGTLFSIYDDAFYYSAKQGDVVIVNYMLYYGGYIRLT